LYESGFMSRWFDWIQMEVGNVSIHRNWSLVLAPVTYHSPARKFLTDSLTIFTGGSVEKRATRPPSGPPRGFFGTSRLPTIGLSETAVGKLTFGDVVREECELRNISLVPKMGIREAGCQVYRLGNHTVYWKDDGMFEKQSTEWVEISLDSILR
jgi:hypothetical protein